MLVDMLRKMLTWQSRTSPIPVNQPIQGKWNLLGPTRASRMSPLLSYLEPIVKKFLYINPSITPSIAMIARCTPSPSSCGILKAGPHGSSSSRKLGLLALRRAMIRSISSSNFLDIKDRPTTFRIIGAPSMMFLCATPILRTSGTSTLILLFFHLLRPVHRLTTSRLPTWRRVYGTSSTARVVPSMSKAWWMSRLGRLLS